MRTLLTDDGEGIEIVGDAKDIGGDNMVKQR